MRLAAGFLHWYRLVDRHGISLAAERMKLATGFLHWH